VATSFSLVENRQKATQKTWQRHPFYKKRVVKKKSPKAIASKWQNPHNNDMGKP
jgi:hypothetical protein